MKYMTYVFPRGTVAHFKGGMYITGNEEEIEHLDAQIKANAFAGLIFIDPNARTVTAEQENPMLALRKKFFAEFLSEQQRLTSPDNDMGETDQGRLNPASTTDIAPVAIGGDGTQMSARLVELAKNLAGGASTEPAKA
jgi:hypothetical protein